MEAVSLSNFVKKVLEVELMFKSLSQHDHDEALKLIKAMCRKCEQIMESAVQSCNNQYLEDSCSPGHIVKSLLCNVINEAIKTSEEKEKTWPSSRLRERRPSSKSVSRLLYADDNHDNTDNVDDSDYDADTGSKSMSSRKRKQTLTKKTSEQSPDKQSVIHTPKKRGRKPSAGKTPKAEPLKNPPAISPPIRLSESKVLPKESLSLFKMKQKRGRPPKRKIFPCEKCDKTFTHAQSLVVHAMEHGDAPGSCRLCKKEFVTVEDVTLHRCAKKIHRKMAPRLCRVCGDELLTVKLLQEHMQKDHGVIKKYTKYTCKYCGKEFIKKITMFNHYKQHAEGKIVCMKCGEFCLNQEAYGQHMSDHEKGAKFTCLKCGSNFHQAQHFDQHMLAHERHDCTLCKKNHTSRKELVKHYREVHNETLQVEESKHECDVCQKKFSRPSMMIIHKRIHTGEKPVECGDCKLFFRTTKALFKHKQTYSHSVRAGEGVKERGFLCNICGKAYFRKHALKRHMQYHTGDKPHMCQYCGYKCREANNLKRHMSLHFESERNFVCEICGAAFHAKKTLEMHHAYKHNDTREFSCDQCDLRFKAKNALKRHMKVHCTEKEHKCWCGTAFKRMYNLRRHLKAVHGTDDLLPPVRRVHTLDSNSKTPSSRTDAKNNDFPLSQEEIETFVKNVPKPSTSVESNNITMPQQTHMATPTQQEVEEGMKFVPHGIVSPHPQNQDTLEVPHHHSTPSPQQQTIITPQEQHDMSIRMRFNPADTHMYNNIPHPVELNDPYLQTAPQVGGNNFIPQAVAYSTILREYGPQFPFVQDSTNYHGFVK